MQGYNDAPALRRVLHFFEEISKIPRRSFVTAPIADYLCRFAEARGLFYLRDEADNVIIRKAASRDAKSKKTLILQAHTDMVFAKADPNAVFDENEGLTLLREGDSLFAKGTTLGADDGIGMAYILAFLDDAALSHPAIEAIFTSNEEVGLLGATALTSDAITGDMLINLDSDEEGIFTAGCAGGSTATLTLPMKRETEKKCFTLSLCGLPGGHSGADIHKGIANAILLLTSMLERISKNSPLRLASMEGGEASNAIPTFASATFHCDMSFKEIDDICKLILANESDFVGDARISLQEEKASVCMNDKESAALIRAILAMPRGILAMDKNLTSLPETSLNLGMIGTKDNTLTLTFALRSSVDESRKTLEKKMTECAEAIGGSAVIDGVYPAWEYAEISPLREACVSVFRERYGSEPTVSIIHAGLECGIFAEKRPGLDSISFGPENKNIHTPEEMLSLSSAARVYDYLISVLAALAK